MEKSKLYQKRCELLVAEAKRWIGVSEKGGDNKGPEVEMFQRAVDGKAQGEAWCLAFVQFCVKRVDAEAETIMGGPNLPDWLWQTEHCMTLWNNMPVGSKLKEPPHPGCLIVWQYWKDGKPTPQGHVGIITEIVDLNTIKTIEGNTGPGLGVEREGDGVYEKRRSLTGGGSMKVKGFLMAWDPSVKAPGETS